MTGDEYAKKYGLKRPKDTAWGEYLQATLDLDRGKKARGYHWFWGLSLLEDKLPNFSVEKIKKELPSDSPYREGSMESNANLRPLVDALKVKIGDPAEIDKIDFSGLMFEELVDFSFFIFPAPIDFKNTHFLKHARFIKTVFHEAEFVDAYFRDKASFSSIKVLVKIDFSRVNFFSSTSFLEAKIGGIIKFNQAKFSGVLVFQDVTFKQSAYFIGAQFEDHVPYFYNANLNADIIWDWDVNFWPSTGKHKNDITDENHEARVIKNQSAYENLSSHMKKLDKYHDEHFFYRQEMRCRRWRSNYTAKCFYVLYEWLSDYGYGIKQALFYWFIHIFVGSIFIGDNATKVDNNGCDLANNYPLDFAVSFANAHGFLPFHKGALKGCYEAFAENDIFNIIWGVQTIVGIPLLFLLVLTVRIRFRLK